MTAPPLPRAEACPLCGRPNQCALEVERLTGEKQPPCWCTQVDFSPEVLARVPPEAKGIACLCPACSRPIGKD